ncbi:Galactoside 2-alpha-L-fucosyltransferase [Triticum urartu]|uniref:Galactoside 2-alpha-L-fucosyltransferase n=1 Tax=Triticum urartu TaxID=4572 RepID=M8A6V8_TRIUA|nr:Galactoside 2-alpha-L-fucosyltransferase [Triticum urartu]
MEVERSSTDAARDPAPSSSSSLADLETAKRRPRRLPSRQKSSVPAVCVLAATVLAVVVFSADSPWSFLQDAPPSDLTADQLLDGLLTAEFSKRSCRSRYEFASYHEKKKNASHKPSPYLLGKLRRHEALQKRCGPGTAPYRAAVRQLKSGKGAAATDCRYLISISYRGLGNRMLATASAFLYAVLTDRVLLIHQYKQDISALFCEPFPGTTWLLPSGRSFPLGHLRDYGIGSNESLGNMLKANVISVGAHGNASWSDGGDRRPPFVYLHLEGGYDFHDKLFYCDEHQLLLHGAPWLLMKTDSYLVPGLFLVPSFQDELGRMFPEKDMAFFHLGRYLFHPVNDVWRAVTSYYRTNLAGVGQRVGIQIRVFQKKPTPLQHILDQVLSCVRREKLLPEITSSSKINASDQAILVTSLSAWYYERIREEYGGGRVAGGVHQPSHEGRQKWGDTSHDRRALSEMYLLSTCDVLVTTGFSTFGDISPRQFRLSPSAAGANLHLPAPADLTAASSEAMDTPDSTLITVEVGLAKSTAGSAAVNAVNNENAPLEDYVYDKMDGGVHGGGDEEDELQEIEGEVFEASQTATYSKRSKSYTQIEDEVLIRAWEAVSLDAIHGTDQTGKRMMKKMMKEGETRGKEQRVGMDVVAPEMEKHEAAEGDMESSDPALAAGPREHELEPVGRWQDDLTVRGMVAALLIGCIYTVIVMRMSLTTGLVPTLNVSAALLSFLALRGWTSLLDRFGIVSRPFTPQENTIVQTCGVACYTIAFAGIGRRL